MRDREFLMWLHERLEHVHGESELVDYMHKLRSIIANTPSQEESPSVCLNSLEALENLLKEREKNDCKH